MTKLKKLSAVEDVLMVGYPIGMSDEINHYPIENNLLTSKVSRLFLIHIIISCTLLSISDGLTVVAFFLPVLNVLH